MRFPLSMILCAFLCPFTISSLAGDCYYVDLASQSITADRLESNEPTYLQGGFRASVTLAFNDEDRQADILIKPLGPLLLNTVTNVNGSPDSRTMVNLLWSVTFRFDDGSILETTGSGQLTGSDLNHATFYLVLDVETGSGIHSSTTGKLAISGVQGSEKLIIQALSGRLCKVRSFAHPFK